MKRPQFTLYRGAAVADATGPGLQKDMSVLVADKRILSFRPTSAEGILPPDVRIIDAGGSMIVPGMVDAHSHVTLPGGSHWIDRGFDPPEELRAVVEHAHGRGAFVTAHSGFLAGARVGIDGGVDSLEHGFELDSDAVAAMARQKMFLVSTLAIFRSWASFSSTTTIARFVSDEGKERIARRRERAIESVRLAHRAGVRIAAGTDFGGGSLRANHLAWEVESLVEAGLQPWEALASATVRGGELLDDPDAGRIFEGGPADFFLVHGDPLTDPTALWRVWRGAWLTDPSTGPWVRANGIG